MKIKVINRLTVWLCLLSLGTGFALSPLASPPAMAASNNYLHTSGSKILDSSNRVVGLSGVNWFGFETANDAPHGLWSRNWQDMLDQIKSLGYNVIRLPFSDAMLQPGVMPNSIDYTKNPDLQNLTALQVMDKIVEGARQRGIKIILDNHRSTAGGGPESNGLWYTSGFPESGWVDDWKMLANRYGTNDAVIGADLRNEPHGDACWGCGDTTKDWRLAAERGGNAILAINPNWLIIVEGISTFNGQSTWWGGNLMGARDYPVRLSIPDRLVYSPHEYPASVAGQPWFTDATYPSNMPAIWDKYWGFLGKDNIAPIMVGEFGSRLQTTSDQQWFQAFTAYMKQGSLSWTFWSLNPDSGDTGGLLADDWKSVVQVKQDVLKALQFAFLGVATATGPTATPLPSSTPTRTALPFFQGPGALLEDFESVGALSRWLIFKGPATTITSSLVSPGAAGTQALKVVYSLSGSGYGGVQQAFTSPQDWSSYAQISFSLFGGSTGHAIRLELMAERAPGSAVDTSERFEYLLHDDFSGWKTIRLSWSQFSRRSDWQPAGAPSNGLTLRQVWGYSFAPLNGTGTLELDEIRLLNRAAPSPTLSNATATATVSAPSARVIDNFDSGSLAGWSLFRDDASSIDSALVSPGKDSNHAYQVTATVVANGWAGAQLLFASPQNWTGFVAMDFWMMGHASGSPLRLELLDNRQPGSAADTSERFVYIFNDDWTGWKHFHLPWSAFSRRTDWQPAGAPNDGLSLSNVWGINFSVISGSADFQIDGIQLTTS